MAIDPAVARRTLAGVRLLNGTLGLLAPELLLKRLGTDPAVDGSGVYPFRMFGIRTVLLGADLLLLDGEDRRRATRMAVVIHASDTLSAACAGRRGHLPKRVAVLTTTISAVNTVLAVIATRDA